MAEQEGSVPRNTGFDARDWYPLDVYRKLNPVWPKDFKIDVGKMLREKVPQRVNAMFGADD